MAGRRQDLPPQEALHLPFGVLTPTIPSSAIPDGPQRTRVPPRSRTGCWTCRSRKVKCDEQRPSCGQCWRLQHECDYNPRLVFRDDTRRVVERNLEVSSLDGNIVWDPQPNQRDGSRCRLPEDPSLPPFTELNTDEEREKKAQSQTPGTYHVVINQDSFSSPADYSELGWTKAASEGGPAYTNPFAEDGSHSPYKTTTFSEDSGDPNVVILRRFDDSLGTGSVPKFGSTSGPAFSMSKLTDGLPRSADTTPADTTPANTTPADTITMFELASQAGEDMQLLQHYRDFISQHLTEIHHAESQLQLQESSNVQSADAFETQGALFPPLYHAMMALSALSLSHRDGVKSLAALQHYQQALPSLQSTLLKSQDLSSDGVLFTHFFLLLYEIAAVEQHGPNLWLNHLTHILRVILTRTDICRRRCHSLLIWFLCATDIYASFTAACNGEFVQTIIDNDLLPVSQKNLPILNLGSINSFFPDELVSAPTVFHFLQCIIVHACSLSRLASEFRSKSSLSDGTSTLSPSATELTDWKSRIAIIQANLRNVWTNCLPSLIPADYLTSQRNSLPPRIQGVFEHAFSLHRASLIYSHTSMYAYQTPSSSSLPEISQCTNEILTLAQPPTPSTPYPRFLAFPLFLAGMVASATAEKQLALELLQKLERGAMGSNTGAIRQLLQTVMERQGKGEEVDWFEVMEERGLQIVDLGF